MHVPFFKGIITDSAMDIEARSLFFTLFSLFNSLSCFFKKKGSARCHSAELNVWVTLLTSRCSWATLYQNLRTQTTVNHIFVYGFIKRIFKNWFGQKTLLMPATKLETILTTNDLETNSSSKRPCFLPCAQRTVSKWRLLLQALPSSSHSGAWHASINVPSPFSAV